MFGHQQYAFEVTFQLRVVVDGLQMLHDLIGGAPRLIFWQSVPGRASIFLWKNLRQIFSVDEPLSDPLVRRYAGHRARLYRWLIQHQGASWIAGFFFRGQRPRSE
jgi:hypothetical protein